MKPLNIQRKNGFRFKATVFETDGETQKSSTNKDLNQESSVKN